MSCDLELSHKEMESVAQIIGAGSVRFYINRISQKKPIAFEWEEAFNFERDCASIQYVYARACKLLSKPKFDEYIKVKCVYEFKEE